MATPNTASTAHGSSGAPADQSSDLNNLPGEHQAIHERTTADLDLRKEIRMMRTILGVLEKDIPENYRGMVAVFSALMRAIRIQVSLPAGTDELDQMWEKPGEPASEAAPQGEAG